jgi:hypothetical protein
MAQSTEARRIGGCRLAPSRAATQRKYRQRSRAGRGVYRIEIDSVELEFVLIDIGMLSAADASAPACSAFKSKSNWPFGSAVSTLKRQKGRPKTGEGLAGC